MRGSVLWKLLAINVPIIALVIMVVWLTIDYLAADYFAVLMEKYNISPAETHQMFLDAVHRYLIQASLAAVALGLILSLLLTRKVLKPLSRMAEVTRRVAAGDYTAIQDALADARPVDEEDLGAKGKPKGRKKGGAAK